MKLHLNIRRKAALTIIIYLLAMGVMGLVSYSNLMLLEKKFRLVEIADDLESDILEIRRYEKNFLLFGRDEDLQENSRFARQGLAKLEHAGPLTAHQKSAQLVNALHQRLVTYRKLMDAISVPGQASSDADHLVERLRQTGKDLVEISRALVAFERERIMHINQRLKTNLLVSAGVMLALSVVLLFFVNRYVIRPLHIVEETTGHIAKGEFERLGVPATPRDEIQSLMAAFNHMVEKLERRQKQLVQAQKLSSIGTLASGIAHQLNNPLNNIATSCQLLRDELGDDVGDIVNRMLDNIHQETFRARDIVRGLLEFSRQEDFRLETKRLKEVVDRSVSLVSSQLPSGVEISVNLPDDLVLPLDIRSMQEVFINLLMNAMQAIEEPPGRIEIGLAPSEDEERVVVTVSDTGKGIPPAHLSRIFDPFYTTKETGDGTGLGLYIVYGIIKKHGGTMRVESEEGRRTTFFMELPLNPAEAEVAE